VNLRPHRPREPDINLTPLIDVVFLLLIFFMVSTTFDEDARLRLQLPEADGEPVRAEEIELVEIVIDRAGRHYVDDRQVLGSDTETLKKALVGVVGPRRDLPVLIKADAATPHQAVMRALDAAAQLGLTRIAFGASRPAAVE
jgi:biopolymer transport protein ExbD